MHVAWVYDHSATRHYAYINGITQGSATGTAYNNSTVILLLGVNKGDASGYLMEKFRILGITILQNTLLLEQQQVKWYLLFRQRTQTFSQTLHQV